ncbi:MAG: DNA-binding response regulator [Leptothrix sp. (in: Bacteria)]|nr:DNA-binding response regulator [Leptothrix sp. (in: b-proteobacteria)]
MIRVLIADDHALVRRGLQQVLQQAPGVSVVGEASDGWQVLEMLRAGAPDLIMLDLSMPGPNGVDLVKRIKALVPHVPILVVSMHAEGQIASRIIKAGAAGYLTKDNEPETLIAAIRQVARGKHFIDPRLATELVFGSSLVNAAVPHSLLSDREFGIFMAIARGRSINDIALELHLSAKTVSTHKARLMQKMGINNISELVLYASEQGLLV